MKIQIEKKIYGQTIIIATNDNGELKIGSKRDFISKHMRAFSLSSGCFFQIDDYWIHTMYKDNKLFCQIGKDISENNDFFPFVFLDENEFNFLSKI